MVQMQCITNISQLHPSTEITPKQLKENQCGELYKKAIKSHTCEGGAHLRISVQHLMMNLKNSYLLKKLLKWANKKCMNFNIYSVVFFLKK